MSANYLLFGLRFICAFRYDIAFRSSEEPIDKSRADFLTRCSINSKRGYRALLQSRLPLQQLAKQVPWTFRLAPFIHRTIPEFSEDIATTTKNIRRHDLLFNTEGVGPLLHRETEAREQLALDLTLASNVYSPMRIERKQLNLDSAFDDMLETMSRATEAMSLGPSDIPAMKFGFFRPSLPAINYTANSNGQLGVQQHLIPNGVNLLLQDWSIGADPRAYEYVDPYGVAPSLRHTHTQPSIRPARSQQGPPTLPASGKTLASAPTERQRMIAF